MLFRSNPLAYRSSSPDSVLQQPLLPFPITALQAPQKKWCTPKPPFPCLVIGGRRELAMASCPHLLASSCRFIPPWLRPPCASSRPLHPSMVATTFLLHLYASSRRCFSAARWRRLEAAPLAILSRRSTQGRQAPRHRRCAMLQLSGRCWQRCGNERALLPAA